MKRTGFAPRVYERRPVVVTPIERAGIVRMVADEVAADLAKDGSYRSEAWRRAVASLPCARCLKDGPSQCAHVNHRGKSLGMKAPDCWSFPMCPECHTDFDQGTTLTKAEKREFADTWVLLTIKALAVKGLIRP
jgi:hypothetical protein